MKAGLIAIDGLDVFMNLISDSDQRRNEINRLHNWLKTEKLTALMTMKALTAGNKFPSYEFLDFMVDCVLHLDHRISNQVSTRRLRIIKYRGSSFARNECPYSITENGIYIVPISSNELSHMELGEKMLTGHQDIDRILSGGYRRGSSILISGASGTGKTILTCTFAIAASQRQEKTLIINFEESKDAAVKNMLSPGLDLRPNLQSGNLRFIGIMPESSGSEEHLIRIFKAIDEFAPDHLIIDAISAIKRSGADQSSSDFLKRLMHYTKELGITLFYINQTEGFINTDQTEISGINISSLLDTVIFLRYIETGDKVKRVILVMKARGSYHSNRYHEYRITDKGIDFTNIDDENKGMKTE
ncbi:ATPase domain-containing protein [Desulfobacterales bacterium HSG17]|nr:ATPase domain-containing protein [Desulfobacterales bacterium HSG17]